MRLLSVLLMLAQSPMEICDTPEAYEVYSTVLADEGREATIAIVRETKFQPMCLETAGESKILLDPAIANYARANVRPRLLQRRFVVAKPYDLVEKDTSRSASWKEFSAVGFNADKTIAVFYSGYDGGGTFHVLQKYYNKWLPIAWQGSACAWAS